jgi:molecular chaperone DnaJ
MTRRDYYEVLGISRDADEQALKSSYRKLAREYHPDRNPGDKQCEEKFKEAAEAYSVLSDPQKRAAYDRFGHAGVQGAVGPQGFDPEVFQDFSDIIGDLFGFGFGDVFGGGRNRRNRARRGDDLLYNLEISFEDSIRGMSAEIQVPGMEQCERCKGRGAEPEDGVVTCSTCRGRGEVIYQQSFLSVRRTCGQCGGTGQIIRRPCRECRGEGHIRRERKLRVTIPAGVDTGMRLRLSQEGQPGSNGGPPGDLYVQVKVTEHPVFERQGNDLHCTVPVNVAQATLGTSVDLLTFDGLQTVKIPESSQSGSQVKLKGLGVPSVNGGGRGDLFVNVDVRTPTRLTREQRRLFEELRQLLPEENEPQEKGLFEKVKDYFT